MKWRPGAQILSFLYKALCLAGLSAIGLIFGQSGWATLPCPALMSPPESLAKVEWKRIFSGERSLYYYSGFGTSYGRDPFKQLRAYLKVGGRLSPRGWALHQNLRKVPTLHLTDHELTRIIVEFFSPRSLASDSTLVLIQQRLGSSAAFDIFNAALIQLRSDIEAFRKNRNDTMTLDHELNRFFLNTKNRPAYSQAKRALQELKNNPDLRSFWRTSSALFRERWNDSFDPASPTQIQTWKAELERIRESAIYKELTPEAKELLDAQIKKYAIYRFYENYGGLYNRRDESYVWHAGGPAGLSRESFQSIQGFFAKGGMIFEFKPSSQTQISWPDILRPETLNQNRRFLRDTVSLDTIGTQGNLIPDDLSRVYVLDLETQRRVAQIFEEEMGPAFSRSGIEILLFSDQPNTYSSDFEIVQANLAPLGSSSAPEVKPVIVGERTFFVSDSERSAIRSRTRSIYSYLQLDGNDSGLNPLLNLFNRQAQSSFSSSNSGEPPPTLFSGGEFQRTNGTRFVMSAADEFQHFGSPRRIVLEIRPDSPSLTQSGEHQLGHELDLRQVSRIYCPIDLCDRIRTEFLSRFGTQSLHRWGVQIESFSNLGRNYETDLREFIAAQESSGRSNVRLPNLLRQINTSDFVAPRWSHLDLSNGADQAAVREFLTSSQNFGIEPYQNLQSTMTPHEYQTWIRLQDKVISAARTRAQLTPELVDDFLILAAQSTDRHQPSGYRVAKITHEIWPGGKSTGKFWTFELSEAQHLVREPFLEAPTTIFRTSPTTLSVDRLAYMSPGPNIRSTVVGLLEAYHSDPRDPVAKALLLYKDLIALHPVTDGNGRGCRAILSYLLLREGVIPPSFELTSSSDLYLTGISYLNYMEVAIMRGWQSYLYGGPPTPK